MIEINLNAELPLRTPYETMNLGYGAKGSIGILKSDLKTFYQDGAMSIQNTVM